jgi:mannose/fructose/N-acetylgalactosamine-specific phosphotransferase system component IID
MTVVAIAWTYVVLMMSLVEALSPQGTVLGAVFTFLLYGVFPLGIVLYVMGAPARRRARARAEAPPAEDG